MSHHAHDAAITRALSDSVGKRLTLRLRSPTTQTQPDADRGTRSAPAAEPRTRSGPASLESSPEDCRPSRDRYPFPVPVC